jgi:AcrR family transcriptional regulator
MDGALAVIAERGMEGLSLREVAAQAGVSNAAPYYHFADKAALVRALAREGDELLAEHTAIAASEAADDPIGRVIAIGMAYVLFASERPDYYAALAATASSMPGTEPSPPSEASKSGFEKLVGTVIECQAADRLPAGDPLVLAVALWSLVHGLIGLWRSGHLQFVPLSSEGLEPLANAVLRAGTESMQKAAEGPG